VPQTYLPILISAGIAIALGATLIALSWAAGLKTGGRVKYSTYESGMPLLDRSRKRLSIAFFLIAIDFVVFDVEAAFLYPWTVVVRDGGWPLFWAVGVFLLLIVAGYAYVWRKGGLELATRRARPATGGTR
jgi:NADH-quinone oxidoreductase subunit A